MIEKVPEGVRAVSEAAVNTFTKLANHALRKGRVGAREKGDLVKVST